MALRGPLKSFPSGYLAFFLYWSALSPGFKNDRHALGDMLWGQYRTYIAETIRKLVNNMRILVHYYVATGTECKTYLQFYAKRENASL